MNPVTDVIENAGPVQTKAAATPATKQANAKAKDKDNKQAKPAKPGKATKPAAKGTKPAKNAKPGKKTPDAKQAKTTKKAVAPAKKAAKTGERSNKKAEVIAMMERAKGATLAEIMDATGWQKHTVRGFVSIQGSKGGRTIESSKNSAGERTYKITK
jgi:hypothetical protein